METTKERIVEHAAELFAKKGCKTLTMDDIATSLGMSKRTIYENFSNKNELIEACLNHFFDHQDINIKQVLKSSDNIIEAMYKQVQNSSKMMGQIKFDFFNEIRKYYPEVYNNTIKVHKEQIFQNTLEVLQKGQKEGIISENVNVLVAAILMHEITNMILTSDVFDEYDVPKQDLLSVMYFLTRGIAADKGLKIIDEYVEKYKINNKV